MEAHNANVRSRSESDKNAVCENCGEAFHAYIIPGREEYKCDGCKF